MRVTKIKEETRASSKINFPPIVELYDDSVQLPSGYILHYLLSIIPQVDL